MAALIKQGSEAKLYNSIFFGKKVIVKERFSKKYRHEVLDEFLTKERIRSEARSLQRCRILGIRTPFVYFVDTIGSRIYMEQIENSKSLKDYICSLEYDKRSEDIEYLRPIAKKVGKTVAAMHAGNIIHGDLTTSNMLLIEPLEQSEVILIDFGLSYIESSVEDKGVDLYVLERAYQSTHSESVHFFEVFIQEYSKHYPQSSEIIKKLNEVRLRGRKRTMVG